MRKSCQLWIVLTYSHTAIQGTPCLPAFGFWSESLEQRVFHYTQEGDASIVVAVTVVTFILIQGDVTIMHVLWNLTFHPALAKQFMKMTEEGPLPTLYELGWDAI